MENTKRQIRKPYLSHLNALFEHQQVLCDPNVPIRYIKVLDSLNYLRALLMDTHPPQPLVKNGTVKRFKSYAREASSIISEFDIDKICIDMALELLKDLADATLTWNSWLYSSTISFAKWPKPSREYYTRTGQHGYVDHLIEYLEQLMLVNTNSTGPLKYCILRLQPMLHLVSLRLVEIPEQRKDLKNLMEEIANLACDIEYAIDLFFVKEIPLSYSVFWLQEIQSHLDTEIGQLIAQLNAESGDMTSIISDILHDIPLELKIIPILNTTEIDEKLDEISEGVAGRFDLCTWCLVSSYKERKREVFLQLIGNASSHKPSIREGIERIKLKTAYYKTGDELKRLLYFLLEDKRYFIILKYMDAIEDFDNIEVFPDHNKSSRILLATHSPDLVAYCRSGSLEHLSSTRMSEGDTTQQNKPTNDENVLGFETETQEVLNGLLGEPKELRIISIVGMAGQGKTTLAKKLYNHLSIVNYFDTRAWVCVSQVYLKREMLLELLSQVLQLNDTIHLKNDEELAAKLYQSLMGQRFLVVLDDLWDTEAWNDLKRCFPNQKNGSRIIFTTRQEKLGCEAQSRSMLQALNPLSDDESWALLQNKLFLHETCPHELLEIGKEIAKYCKGLPLSIVLTAGLLMKMEKRKDVWKDIAKNLSSHILKNAKEEDKGVIQLSYKHLPDPLKPCFLYFGAFLEDREVPVQKLIRLWIAEGFVKHSDSKSLEDVAEDYLLDLIGRSLVIVAQEKSNGGVKSCRVHDLLREYALTKAKEENVFEVVQGYDKQLDLNSKSETIYKGFLCGNFSKLRADPVTYHQCRLCIYSKSNHFFNLRADPLGPHVRSLLFFTTTDMFSSYLYDISFIFRNFKLLRILNFEEINIGNSFREIDVLIHLRYLAVQGTMVSIPPSIANLVNLETFCVKILEEKVVEVPDSIWNIPRLRHLHINGHASFDIESHRLEDSSVLHNLQTLSTPSLEYGSYMEKLLRKLRGSIRKLKCVFLDSWDEVTKRNQFPVLEFLDKLESLKVFYNGKKQYPCVFNFPLNLKKLTLTNFGMPWSEFEQLAKLPNLEILKIVRNAFEGEKWEMGDEVIFSNLKFLKLDSLNVVEWISNGEHFPRLERLILHKCEKLEEIPPIIGEADTLLMIEVMWCTSSAAYSAKHIQEEQLEYGNERLKINVHPKVWDSELSL